MSQKKSTIDRAATPLAPTWMRATFAVLEHASPRLAGRLADTLWFRLPGVPSEATRQRHMPDGGQAVRLRTGIFDLESRVYGPEDAPVAYLVHGWGGWWQQLGAHVGPLVAAGYRVVVFDSPNHGDSGPGGYGRSSRIYEIADAYAAMVDQHGPPALVVAHSAGVMAVMWAAVRGTRADAYAFVSASVSVHAMVDWFRQVLGLGPRSVQRLVMNVERRIGYSFEDFEVVDMLAEAFRDPPALLCIHDADDGETPVEGSRALAAAWPNAELVVTQGLGHRRVLWDPDVVDRVARFAQGVRRVRVDGDTEGH